MNKFPVFLTSLRWWEKPAELGRDSLFTRLLPIRFHSTSYESLNSLCVHSVQDLLTQQQRAQGRAPY